jgi:hypothetical protein
LHHGQTIPTCQYNPNDVRGRRIENLKKRKNKEKNEENGKKI